MQGLTRAPAVAEGRGAQTDSIAGSQGKMSWFIYGLRVGMCPGVGPEGWLRWFAYPSGGVMCGGHTQYYTFVLGSSEVAVGFLVSFVSHMFRYIQ